jgi:preprotein translocase subunit SecY
MLSAFTNSFKIPELRQRIIFTLAMVIIVRIGAAIPCPGVNSAVLSQFFNHVVDQASSGSAGNVIGLFNIFSGGALENCAIFSLGIMPYISASIMMQLLTAVVPSMGKLAREEGGRQKITQYTRIFTIALCLFQGYLFAIGFEHPDRIPLLRGIADIEASVGPLVPDPGLAFRFICVVSLTAGTMLLMWLGEQITDKGIGNGISMVITVGIVARMPAGLVQGFQKVFPTTANADTTSVPILLVVILLAFVFAVVAGTIAITQAMRKIPVQYARQVRGNKVYGGQTSFLPLKVNYAGVMPIIFAQSILVFPSMILGFMFPNSIWVASITHELNNGLTHYILYGGMILFFSYFWVATQFNPIQIADDLKKHGGFVPGVRPGQPTAEFLDFTMTRLTLAGAVFLTFLAVLPMLATQTLQIPYITAQFFGGTSLLIMVGVMLDTMRQMETYLLQRHYDGFLKKGRLRGRSSMGNVGAQGQSLDESSMMLIYIGVAALLFSAAVIWFFFKQ